ncbi:MAG: LuxR C-terminal-related transcriptional regulator [Nannocystaceae bacterium]
MVEDGDDGCSLVLQEGRVVQTPAVRHFASSEEFFAWLREELVDEGRLTEAEEETCELLLLGRNYLEIAAARHVSLETIKWHVKRILRKLDVDSTRELLLVVGYRIDQRAKS